MTEEKPISGRGKVDLVGHVKLPPNAVPNVPITNVIVQATSRQGKWVEETTGQIGEWRAECRSTYIRWALALNGLHVAAERYEKWPPDKAFQVTSFRSDRSQVATREVIAEFSGREASERHLLAAPMLCAFGLIDLYACLEEVIFAAYRIWHEHHPEKVLLRDNRPLKRHYRDRESSDEARSQWEEAWRKRLNDWHRKKLYDGLHNVFISYCQHAKINAPSGYTRSSPETWAESIEVFGYVRHMLVHGVAVVDDHLDSLCKRPHAHGFSFTEGQPLAITVQHLMAVEMFTHSLLTALNLSLMEHSDLNEASGE